jgi:hypothetical protein
LCGWFRRLHTLTKKQIPALVRVQAESSSYGTFSSQPVPLVMNHYLAVFIYSEFGETNVF